MILPGSKVANGREVVQWEFSTGVNRQLLLVGHRVFGSGSFGKVRATGRVVSAVSPEAIEPPARVLPIVQLERAACRCFWGCPEFQIANAGVPVRAEALATAGEATEEVRGCHRGTPASFPEDH